MSDAKKLYGFSIARFASLILLCVIADLRLIFHDIPAFRPLLWIGCLMLLLFFFWIGIQKHSRRGIPGLPKHCPRCKDSGPLRRSIRTPSAVSCSASAF